MTITSLSVPAIITNKHGHIGQMERHEMHRQTHKYTNTHTALGTQFT